MPDTREAGWALPYQSKKNHYFPAGNFRSLCGKWGWVGVVHPTGNGPAWDCQACWRKSPEGKAAIKRSKEGSRA